MKGCALSVLVDTPETQAVDDDLPTPPSEEEKYSYLGAQNRWLLALQALSFSLIAYSVLRFATADIRLLLFLVPMTLYAVTLVISLTSGTRKRRVNLADHVEKVASWRPGTQPSVDVFLPTAGEPLEVLANTYRYVAELTWRGALNVWVLDDGARPEVEELARRHGFHYGTRPDRGVLKKAGNLRFGYEQSDGDLILILDADFVPRHDMLSELAPYFDDPTVGIVQSPQFFDTRRPGMHWLQRCAGATQELFYRFIQPSRDRVGAAICVGTCAMYSRSALVAAGGFAQIGHSEDVHTGVKLMKAGRRLVYVPVVVSKGLCPDAFSAFLNQQYRWCTGSMSLLADRKFHENPVISTRQRLCFWAGFLYYISTAVNAVIAPLPAVAMLWMLPEWVEPMNSIWLVGALALWFVVLPLVMKGRWRFDVLRVQYLYSFAHLTAIGHILSGRTREWVATGAAGRTTPLAVTISRNVKAYVLVTQVVLWAGLIRGAMTYGVDQYWAMLAMGVLGSYIQVPLLFIDVGQRVPRAERRAAKRAAAQQAQELDRAVPAQRGPRDRVPATATPAGVAETTHDAAPGPRRFRADIQGLRAIAVLLVILYHANVPGITGGYVGVDVFFVISGFLITGQLLREADRTGRISLLKFYGGRIRRLLPPAVLVVAVTLVAARLWDSIFNIKNVSMDALATLVYGINYRLAATGVDYQNADAAPSPLQHMWSLAVEEQFYVIWPLLIAVCAFLGGKHRRALIAAVLVAGASASLWMSVSWTGDQPSYSYFGIHTRAWELAVGALVAMAATGLARMGRRTAVLLSWGGVAAVVASALVYTDATAFPGSAALWPTLATAAVIAAGCAERPGTAERLLALSPMQVVGNVSYGWYLWHWPMVVLIPLAVGQELHWLYLVEISALALWFAVLTHHLVENPARRSQLRPARWLGTGLVMSGAAAGVALLMMASLPSFVGSGAAAQAVKLDPSRVASVQKALVGGLSATEAPSNLRPALTKAAEDQPPSTYDGCHAGYSQVAQGDCVYGDPNGKKTVVLVGDSHAQQWLPGLDAEARNKGWKVQAWTKAACPIADVTVVNDALGRDYTECDTWREKTVKRVEKLDPDMVVVSQSDSVPGTQVSNTTWADSTASTLAELQAADLDVTYVLDTPMPEGDVAECVAVHIDDVGACNVPSEKTELYDGRAQDVDEALSSSGVRTFDPTELFCTAQACPAIVGNILVYRDGSHMSSAYSEWLAPMTGQLFATDSKSKSKSKQ